jgi:AcrR family transcriptional regulator
MPPRTSQRRVREREIIDAARALFDERGMQDAPMDEIARAVGITRGLLYRYFASKEELFVLALTRYTDELTELGRARIDPAAPIEAQLRASWENFTDYCLRYPAFLDCALALMRQPAETLRERVSDATWLRLGVSMGACLGLTVEILRRGVAQGVLRLPDPVFTANLLYTQTLGAMHLARSGVVVAAGTGGLPQALPVAAERVAAGCVEAAVALVFHGAQTELAAAVE